MGLHGVPHRKTLTKQIRFSCRIIRLSEEFLLFKDVISLKESKSDTQNYTYLRQKG